MIRWSDCDFLLGSKAILVSDKTYDKLLQSHKICFWNWPIILKVDRHLSNTAAEAHVKFQRDMIIEFSANNLMASRLNEILWQDILLDIEMGPAIGNIFHVTGPLWGESIGHHQLPTTCVFSVWRNDINCK